MSLPKDPLEFFEKLLQKGGLQSLHEGFKPNQEDHKYLDIWYDEIEMSKKTEVQDPETGKKGIEKEFFQDHLGLILIDKVSEARTLLIANLDSTHSSRRKLIENFIIRLEYFIGKARGIPGNDSSLIAKLPIIGLLLTSLLNDIESTYGNKFNTRTQDVPPIEDKADKVLVANVPFFNKEALPDFLKFIQGSFDVGDHAYLKELLEFGNRPPKSLFFNGNANQLADACKQMLKSKLITQCNQTKLVKWIQINFTYNNNGYAKAYNKGTLNKIILSNDPTSICKNPLFKIIIDAKGDLKLTHIT